MDIVEIEKLIEIVKDAGISEISVTLGNPQTTVRLRKPYADSASGKSKGIIRQKNTTPSNPATNKATEIKSAFITAPMVGIFHALDSIAAIGSSVRSGQSLGSIESMKVMNDVISDRDGLITEVLIEDGMPVEYGQKLFKLE